jgi:multiple sugar transport system substrate-binding protein
MKSVKLAVLWMVLLLIVSCTHSAVEDNQEPTERTEPAAEVQEDLLKNNKELIVWSYFNMEDINRKFQTKYPDVSIHFTQIPYADFVDVYLKALISGQPPDVMLIDNGTVGQFNTIRDAFENLRDPPYHGGKYIDLIPPNLKNLYYSFDGEKLTGIPQNITGAVTFYRKDIFELYGLPSEPEAVGLYLEDPKHWIEIGKRLKKDGKSIFQWDTDPLDILAMQESFFDPNYQYVRNSPLFGAMLETSRAVRQHGLSLRSSIWTEAGQEAIRSGQLAAVYMGSWGVADLQRWAPETKGKWRVARLPAGIYGSTGGSLLSIPSRSKNKTLAWEYVQIATELDKEQDVLEDIAFLGGQDITALFRELPYRTKAPSPSPFDQKAQEIWNDAIIAAVATDTSPEDVLEDIQEETEESVSEERKYVLHYLKQR